MKAGKREKIVLNDPKAVNYCRDGILCIFYPRRLNTKVIVRGFISLKDLVAYVKYLIAPYRAVKPSSYGLRSIKAYISQDYRYTEIITFLEVDEDFLADVRKNFRGRLYYEALRLGWIVDENKPSGSLMNETDRAERKEYQKIPENER